MLVIFNSFFYHNFRHEREITNYDSFIGKIWFRSIRINPILNRFLSIKLNSKVKKLKYL